MAEAATQVIPGGGPGPLLTTTTFNPGRGDVVIQAVFGLTSVSGIVFAVQGQRVLTYNFAAYSDQLISAYFEQGTTPVLNVKNGDKVDVRVIAKGGDALTSFVYKK